MNPWYAGGLHFGCTVCGECCTGSPGYVWVSPREIADLARHLGMAPSDFSRTYVRLVGGVTSLVEKASGECIFLSGERRCSVNGAKPRQCLTYPFWPRLLASRASWREVEESCPGVGHGPLYTREEIDVLQDRDTPREELWTLISKARA